MGWEWDFKEANPSGERIIWGYEEVLGFPMVLH